MNIAEALDTLKKLHDLYDAMHLPSGTVATTTGTEREEVYTRSYARFAPDSRNAMRVRGPTRMVMGIDDMLRSGVAADQPVPGPPLIAVDDSDWSGVGYDPQAVLAFIVAALAELPKLYENLYFAPAQMFVPPLHPDDIKRLMYENEMLRQNVTRFSEETKRLAKTQMFEFLLRQSVLKLLNTVLYDKSARFLERTAAEAAVMSIMGSYFQPASDVPTTQESVQRMVDKIVVSMNQPFHRPSVVDNENDEDDPI